LGLAELKLGSVILPRSESPAAISRLAEFEWFHKIDGEHDIVTPEIDDLLLEAQKTYQSVDDVVKGLGIPPTVGMLEILFKGTMIKKKDYELDEVAGMVGHLAKEAPGAISGAARLLEERADTKRALDEYTSLRDTIGIAKRLEIDLSGFGLMRYFYANLFVIDAADYDEIARSLEGAAPSVTSYRYDLSSSKRRAEGPPCW